MSKNNRQQITQGKTGNKGGANTSPTKRDSTYTLTLQSAERTLDALHLDQRFKDLLTFGGAKLIVEMSSSGISHYVLLSDGTQAELSEFKRIGAFRRYMGEEEKDSASTEHARQFLFLVFNTGQSSKLKPDQLSSGIELSRMLENMRKNLAQLQSENLADYKDQLERSMTEAMTHYLTKLVEHGIEKGDLDRIFQKLYIPLWFKEKLLRNVVSVEQVSFERFLFPKDASKGISITVAEARDDQFLLKNMSIIENSLPAVFIIRSDTVVKDLFSPLFNAATPAEVNTATVLAQKLTLLPIWISLKFNFEPKASGKLTTVPVKKGDTIPARFAAFNSAVLVTHQLETVSISPGEFWTRIFPEEAGKRLAPIAIGPNIFQAVYSLEDAEERIGYLMRTCEDVGSFIERLKAQLRYDHDLEAVAREGAKTFTEAVGKTTPVLEGKTSGESGAAESASGASPQKKEEEKKETGSEKTPDVEEEKEVSSTKSAPIRWGDHGGPDKLPDLPTLQGKRNPLKSLNDASVSEVNAFEKAKSTYLPKRKEAKSRGQVPMLYHKPSKEVRRKLTDSSVSDFQRTGLGRWLGSFPSEEVHKLAERYLLSNFEAVMGSGDDDVSDDSETDED